MTITRVRDLMRPNLITCPPNASLGEVAAILIRQHVHAIIIADPTGMPLGVLSDIDLLAGEWLGDDPGKLVLLRALTAAELMSSPAASIDADAPASQAATRLGQLRIHRLVVTDMERAVGVISVSDLVQGLASRPVERLTVADAMTHGIVACRAETSVAAAARAMSERRSREIVVVGRHGQPLGVVTGFDLLKYCTAGDPADPVTQLMHTPLTIGPDASLRAAADLMLTHHIHRLLVVDPAAPDDVPLGLISTSDLMLEMATPSTAVRAV